MKREKVPDDKVVDRIYELAEEILENLKVKAKKFFEENIVSASTKEELIKAIKEGKIVKISFCGREECAEYMREATNGAKVRGTSLNFKEGDYGKCVWCGQPARYIVYVAKAY